MSAFFFYLRHVRRPILSPFSGDGEEQDGPRKAELAHLLMQWWVLLGLSEPPSRLRRVRWRKTAECRRMLVVAPEAVLLLLLLLLLLPPRPAERSSGEGDDGEEEERGSLARLGGMPAADRLSEAGVFVRRLLSPILANKSHGSAEDSWDSFRLLGSIYPLNPCVPRLILGDIGRSGLLSLLPPSFP